MQKTLNINDQIMNPWFFPQNLKNLIKKNSSFKLFILNVTINTLFNLENNLSINIFKKQICKESSFIRRSSINQVIS